MTTAPPDVATARLRAAALDDSLAAIREALTIPEEVSATAARRVTETARRTILLVLCDAEQQSPAELARNAARIRMARAEATPLIVADLAKQHAKTPPPAAPVIDLAELVTVDQAAEILGTPVSTVRMMIEDGALIPSYTGHLLPRAAVEHLAEEYAEAVAAAEEIALMGARSESAEPSASRPVEPAPKAVAVEPDEGDECTGCGDEPAELFVDPRPRNPRDPQALYCRTCAADLFDLSAAPAAEIHDAQAVCDDEPVVVRPATVDAGFLIPPPPAALHDVRVLDHDAPLPGVLVDRDGDRWFPLGDGTYSTVNAGLLTREQIAAAYGIEHEADTIVLERPPIADTIDLSAAVSGGPGKNTPPVILLTENGATRIQLLTGCPSCGHPSFTGPQARTLAAFLALAADDAERSAL